VGALAGQLNDVWIGGVDGLGGGKVLAFELALDLGLGLGSGLNLGLGRAFRHRRLRRALGACGRRLFTAGPLRSPYGWLFRGYHF
jgi:hypothetical protein